MQNPLGILLPPDKHHLDHIAPLCSLYKIPLYLKTESQKKFVLENYPGTQIFEDEDPLQKETWLTTVPQDLLKEFFADSLTHKNTLWCPHGNSDKNYIKKNFSALQKENLLLVYGALMQEELQAQKITQPMAHIGNFRKEYFLKNKNFYQKQLPQTAAYNVLWAPTWQDTLGPSSFPSFVSPLLSPLPPKWHLLIKLHPNLYQQYPLEILKLEKTISRRDNITLVKATQSIYPLLSIVDCLICDRSSIGYDFLSFNRPIFFTPSDQKGPLHECGATLQASQNIFQQLDEQIAYSDNFSSQRKALNHKCFNKNDMVALKDMLK